MRGEKLWNGIACGDKIIKRVISSSFKRSTPFICHSGIDKREKINENIFLNLDK